MKEKNIYYGGDLLYVCTMVLVWCCHSSRKDADKWEIMK